jgi:Ca-activated chloride channel family protein
MLLLLPGVALAKTESWPQLYNTGVTAYQSNDFARASTLFENATSSTDRAMQQRALYNLGNTNYRLGQAQPAQAQQLWQRALKSYETAMVLDPKDADAKFNHDFVKKKLEELQKQQQQQQNQKDQQDKKQDPQKDNQQKQQPQQKQDQQQQQKQSTQSQEQQRKQDPGRGRQESEDDQKQKDEQRQQQQAQHDNPTKPEQQPQEQGGQPENYDKMQATAMLNNLREDERNWNFFPEVQMKDLKDSGEPAKDW